MAEQPTRKLAVLAHADVVGSTALVQLNEILAHQRIQDTFRTFSETITRYNGIAHEIRGDALVAEFARASDAVSASLAFQSANAAHNEALPDEIRPVVRVGISMGEVVVADNTVTGEGVVLAQRLEQLAEPGGICIQDAAYQTIPKRLPFECKNLGECELKGFDEPVRAYMIELKSGADIPQAEAQVNRPLATLNLPYKPSIAVLPFTNMSGDPEQEYFSDGITEDITTALSRISGLLVVAGNPTLSDKAKAIDTKLLGRKLGVHYVLQGSVRKAGNRVRVTVQLIDTTTGHHQWAERYDRDLDDIFAVQDDITRQTTVELRVKLSEGEKVRVLAGRTSSVEAWELLLRADELTNTGIHEDNLESRKLLEEALRIDPHYAAAWTQLANTFVVDAVMGHTKFLEGTLENALDAAKMALEAEENYPTAYTIFGYVYTFRGEHERAVEMLEKAVELEPRNTEIVATCAYILVFACQVEKAIEMTQRAMQLSPITPMWYLVVLGMCYHTGSEQDLALKWLREAIAMEPESAWGRPYLVSALIEAGLPAEAQKTAQEIMTIEPGFSVSNWLGAEFKDTKVKKMIIDNLIKAGLPE